MSLPEAPIVTESPGSAIVGPGWSGWELPEKFGPALWAEQSDRASMTAVQVVIVSDCSVMGSSCWVNCSVATLTVWPDPTVPKGWRLLTGPSDSVRTRPVRRLTDSEL